MAARILQPVRRSWTVSWLLVILVLVGWTTWSATEANQHNATLVRQFCDHHYRLIAHSNRDSTDMLADLWATEQRLATQAAQMASAPEELRLAVASSLAQTRTLLNRRLAAVPAADRGRVLHQLQAGQDVLPPIAFVPFVARCEKVH